MGREQANITNGFRSKYDEAPSSVAIGLIAAFVLTRLMANMLFGIGAHDPLTFLAVAFFLSLVAILAT